MSWLSALSTVLYVVLVYPFYYLTYFAYFLLGLLAAPVLKLGLFAFQFVTLPLRILFKFEALFIYYGVALLTGVGLGVGLYLTTTVIINLLHGLLGLLKTASHPEDGRRRSPVKRVQNASESDPNPTDDYWIDRTWRKDTIPLKHGGLLTEIILEEEEEKQPSQDSEVEQKPEERDL